MSRKKIKVLVIVNAMFGYDGISSVAMNYYLYQDRNSVSMDLMTINPIFDDLAHTVEKNGDRNFVLDYRNRNPLKYILNLSKIIKKNEYDIVHVHGNSATMAVELLAAKLGGCKVRVAHSHNTKCDHEKLNKLLMPFFSRLYTDCCACSKEAGEFLFGGRECYVVNNGIDLTKYRFNSDFRERIRKEHNISNRFVIGHIGRFSYQKNQEYLVELLKQIKIKEKDAVLLLVGQGESEKEIRQQVVDSGLADSVVFYGTTDRVNEVVQAMDVFAFPSRFEGLGIVAIEAQASGLNCVASDAVPRTIAIQEKVSFLALGEDESWADAIIDHRITPQEREMRIKQTEDRLIRCGFDIETNCRDMLLYYESIVEKKG